MSGYVVIVEGDEAGGFSAWSPDLPGCVAAASTYDDCVALMREAIAGHLEVMREHGDPHLGALSDRRLHRRRSLNFPDVPSWLPTTQCKYSTLLDVKLRGSAVAQLRS